MIQNLYMGFQWAWLKVQEVRSSLKVKLFMTLVVTAINSQTLTGHKQGPVISVEVDEASSEGVDAYFS